MKLKGVILGTVALALGTVGFGITQSASATVIHGVTVGYFRATKTFKINIYGTNQKVTIPKNTVVQAEANYIPVTNQAGQTVQVQSGDINFLNLNYKLRRTWPKAHAGGTASFSATARVHLKPIAAPVYMPVQTAIGSRETGSVLTRKMTQTWGKDPWFTITTDGYVAHFAALKKWNSRTQPKPNSSAKITKTKWTGRTEKVYYRHHVKGVPDKRVAKHGRAQYRLKLVRQKKLSSYGKGTSLVQYTHFKVGGKNYYTIYNMPN